MSGQPSTFLLGPVEQFVGLHGQAANSQQVINVAMMAGWTYVLTDAGDLTVQERFRCTKNIAPRGREETPCAASVLAISPHNTRQAFVSLTYPPAPATGPRNSPAGSAYEALLTSCDGSAISPGRLPPLRGAPPTSACWLSGVEIAVGCADGTCHIITLRRVTLRERRGVPTLHVNASVKLALELTRSLAGEAICGLAVLEGGDFAADGCESLLSGRSSSVDGGDEGPRSVVLATRGALVWHSGYGTFGKVLRTDEAVGASRIVQEAPPGESTTPSCVSVAPAGGPLAEDGCRVAWLTSTTLHHLLFPPVPPILAPTPSGSLAAARGGPPTPAPTATAPQEDVPCFKVNAADVEAAVRDAAEGNPLAGGFQVAAADSEEAPIRCVSAAMGRWHTAVLATGADAAGRQVASIALISHITGEVAQVLTCPEGIGDPMFLIQDPQATSADPATSARTPLAATAGIAQAYVVGSAGIAAVLSTSAAHDAWRDFVAVGDFTAALRLLDEADLDLRFAEAERLDVPPPPQLPGCGSTGELGVLRDMELGGHELEEEVRERRLQLQVAKGRVRLAQAETARDSGDLVKAARALGHITAEVSAAGGLPNFQQLALWFQAVPYDTLAVSEAKTAALETFLSAKLRQYSGMPSDAAATSLALWLLEALLARSASEAVSPRPGAAQHDDEPSPEVATFLKRHQAILPWQAVEQILRAGGRRADLKAAARIYRVWPIVFSLSVPGDVRGALEVLPKLKRELLAPSLARLAAADPLATCTALERGRGLACITPLMVAHTMGGLARPDVPLATRTALLRYLQIRVIFSGVRARVLHDLYVVLLILHPEEFELHRYLDSPESRTNHDLPQNDVPAPQLEPELPVSDLQPITAERSIHPTSDSSTHSAGRGSIDIEGAGPGLHPFVFDAFRAVRLAKAHGKRAAARRILVELHAFEAAIELASNYAEGLAVVEEAPDRHMQRRLWLSVLRRVMESQPQRAANGDSEPCIDKQGGKPAARLSRTASKGPHSAAKHDSAENLRTNGGANATPNKLSEVDGSVDALDACISDTVQRELLAVEDVLGLLPEQQTLRSYKGLLVKHMETTSHKVQGAGEKARRAVQVSGALEAQLLQNRKRAGSLAWSSKCFACGAPLRSPPASMVPSGGAIPKIQVFPSGACYHTSCAVELMLRSSAHLSRADHLRDLTATMEQLAACTPHTDRDTVQDAQQRLHRWLREGDPLHTERMLGFLEQEVTVQRPTAAGAARAGTAAAGAAGLKDAEPGISLTLPYRP
eukprot:jgi/Ulvmu1/926/UM102_0009.1